MKMYKQRDHPGIDIELNTFRNYLGKKLVKFSQFAGNSTAIA